MNDATKLNKSVEKEVTKLIIPFMFSNTLQDIGHMLSGDFWCAEEFSTHRLLSNIKSLIVTQTELLRQKQQNQGNAIGTCQKLTQAGRKQFGLPQNSTATLSMTAKGTKYEFSIKEIELFYFETNVGFLVYEIAHNTNSTLKDIIDLNYYCKNVSKEGARVSFQKGRDKETCEFSFYELTNQILKDFHVTGFYEENNDRIRPNRALVYNCVIMSNEITKEETMLQDIGQALFLMRRSFKESYRPVPAEYELANNEEVVQLFENSFWGVSLEGAANLCYLIDDVDDEPDKSKKETNAFFLSTYVGHLKNTYFYLYMLTLHQKYALQRFATDVAQISQSLEDEMLQEKIEDLQKNITFFTLRCLYKEVSGVSHHRVLYNMYQKMLGIRDLLDELKNETEALASLHKQLNEKKRKKADEQEKGVRDFLFIILTIVGLSSSVNAIFSIYKYVNDTSFPSLGNIAFDIVLGFIGIVAFVIIGSSVRLAKLTRRKKKSKKKME